VPSWSPDLVAMLVSTGLGTIIGLERQLTHKPAGLRTHALVCIGSTLFVLLTNRAIADTVAAGVRPSADPTRIIHGVITGIGFLGGGSILREQGNVMGLTTAASIWIVAAIGVSVGVHDYALAVIGTVLALLVLQGFRLIEDALEPRAKH